MPLRTIPRYLLLRLHAGLCRAARLLCEHNKPGNSFMLRTAIVRTTLLALACALFFLCAHAMAGAPTKVDVPAGELATALDTLAKQAGVEFIYSAEKLRGIRTNGVHGQYTAEEAVTKLLEGTNLHVTVHASGALLISDANAAGN